MRNNHAAIDMGLAVHDNLGRVAEYPTMPDSGLPPRIPGASVTDRIHEHEHMTFWQVRGSAVFTCDGHAIHVHENDVLWLPAGIPHHLELHADSVMFPFKFPRSLTATSLNSTVVVQVHDDDTLYLLSLYQSTTTLIRPATNLERQVLALIERNPQEPTPLPMPATRPATTVAKALLFNPGDDRSIEEWAASVHTSSRTLERAFVAETGHTLRDWRHRIRMHAASRLIRSGATITSVSRRVGYANPNSLTRAFRTHFGVSPTEFAASSNSSAEHRAATAPSGGVPAGR